MSDGAPPSPAPAGDSAADPDSLDELEALDPGPDLPTPTRRHGSVLPTSRNIEAPAPVSRPSQKETWEHQKRPTRRPEFADRVTRTTEVTRDPDAPPAPKPPPRRTGAITWDDDKPAAPSAAPPVEEKLDRRRILILAGLSGLVLLLAVAWVIKSLALQRSTPPAAVGPAAGAAPVEAAATPELSRADYQQAVDVAKRFLAAASLDEMMPEIRDPKRVRPLMDEFYKEQGWQPQKLREIVPLDQFQSKGQMLAGMVELGDFVKRAIAFLRTPEGIKVDWESFVGLGEVPWDRLATERPTRPILMRVQLIPDDYYNLDFPDSNVHACYRLMSQGGTHRLFGYVRRDKPLYNRLAARARPNSVIMPTVKIRFKEDGQSNDQVEITELVGEGWLMTEEPATSPAKPPAAPPSPR